MKDEGGKGKWVLSQEIKQRTRGSATSSFILHPSSFLQQPVAHLDGTVPARSQTQVVGDDEQRLALFAHERQQQVDDGAGRTRAVEVARGFVGEDDGRVVDERAGDGDALLLAAGKFERQVVQAFAQADLVQAFGGSLLRAVAVVLADRSSAGSRTFSSAVSSGRRK